MALTEDIQTPVKIHLVTKVRQEGEEEAFELVVFGRHYQKGDTVYLKYDEVQEEGTIHTVVKITGEEALIMRTGAIKMRLRFRLSEEMGGSHDSPFGSLHLSTRTQRMIHRQSEHTCEGRFSLLYDLSMQGSPAGHYEMQIDYKEDPVKP